MSIFNVGKLLATAAERSPDQVAVAVSRPRGQRRHYETITFAELNRDSDRIAGGLRAAGARKGQRLALLVRPGIEFIKLVFAMFKSGVVTILIDPGMGRRNMIRCLAEAQPEGFVAIPPAHAVRLLLRHRFPKATFNVTVGRRWFWGGWTLKQIQELGENRERADEEAEPDSPDDQAAIIFTTGSTGPPKGVLYTHRNFLKQVEEIRDYYSIQPGGVDVSGFPLFALFNGGMGMTTIVPDMDFTQPANVDPEEIIACTQDWNADQSFGSPALWTTVGRYCEENRIRLASLKRVLTAGAPVPPHVLKRLRKTIADDGEIHTPYGATESLPVASIDARTILGETAAQTEAGNGTCVGNRFPGIQWKVIEISDAPLSSIDQVTELPTGRIGELMVKGDVVTQSYATATQANELHKVRDKDGFWHRMGDVGYLDDLDRFWFCGRKGHRVITESGTLFTIPCESVFNTHASIYRTALVGIDNGNNPRVPVLVIETWPENRPATDAEKQELVNELGEIGKRYSVTQSIQRFAFIDRMPVDIRHNSKIFREKLTVWACNQRLFSAG